MNDSHLLQLMKRYHHLISVWFHLVHLHLSEVSFLHFLVDSSTQSLEDENHVLAERKGIEHLDGVELVVGIALADHLENLDFSFGVLKIVWFVPWQLERDLSFELVVDGPDYLTKGTAIDVGNDLVAVSYLLSHLRDVVAFFVGQLLGAVPSYWAYRVDLVEKHDLASFVRRQFVLVHEASLLGRQNRAPVRWRVLSWRWRLSLSFLLRGRLVVWLQLRTGGGNL